MSCYQEGQVWHYRTRPGEERSLVKIQRIEESPDADETIFHISLIRLAWRFGDALPHAPVSRSTLDRSVTHLAAVFPDFPSVEEGIAEWKRASGGVYAVSLAEIVEMGDF
jgi:hypothetical protein